LVRKKYAAVRWNNEIARMMVKAEMSAILSTDVISHGVVRRRVVVLKSCRSDQPKKLFHAARVGPLQIKFNHI
jgi:hypothetical protein